MSCCKEATASLVREEIAEQPVAVARVLADADGAIAAAADEIRRRHPRYAVIAARGSSDNAARCAQHVLGRLCGLPVALATPSLHTGVIRIQEFIQPEGEVEYKLYAPGVGLVVEYPPDARVALAGCR